MIQLNNKIVLVSFYNPKSLGLRYIENALTQNGYAVTVVFFKTFNSVNPKRASRQELDAFSSLIKKENPIAIGLSVMASVYLTTVQLLNQELRNSFDIPIVWGGVHPTMFPKECMEYADFVVQGEGEEAWIELADTIQNKKNNHADIKNLTFRRGDEIISNDLRPLLTDLDLFGVPTIGGNNKYLIEDDAISQGDPQLKAFSYELSASRGCPFTCTYCCSINLNRIHSRKGRYVRFREVDRVMEELLNAKAKMKNLKVIHFWDEIFCDNEDWIDVFVKRYKKEINLPFEIWGHPLKTNDALISKLQKAGLYKVVMGIQSGSSYIRRDIFNRPEKQEDIIRASQTLSNHKVPQVIYDFMLRHPFETHQTIKETYDLCMSLAMPFELQLHGLNFLPGTDIVQKAIDMKLVSPEDMDKLMNAPLEEQYNMHWKTENNDPVLNYWYKLIYLTQFSALRQKTVRLAKDPQSAKNIAEVDRLCKIGRLLAKARYFYQKGTIVMRGTIRI